MLDGGHVSDAKMATGEEMVRYLLSVITYLVTRKNKIAPVPLFPQSPSTELDQPTSWFILARHVIRAMRKRTQRQRVKKVKEGRKLTIKVEKQKSKSYYYKKFVTDTTEHRNPNPAT